MSKLIYNCENGDKAGDYDSWKLEGCDKGEIVRSENENLFFAVAWDDNRNWFESQAVPFAEAESFLRQHCE